MHEPWEIPNASRNSRGIEVVVSKVQHLKMNKPEKAAVGVDRAQETAATKIKANNMTRPLITHNAIPCTAADVSSLS